MYICLWYHGKLILYNVPEKAIVDGAGQYLYAAAFVQISILPDTPLAPIRPKVYDTTMCWKCGKPIESPSEIYRTSVCSVCGLDLHSCRNCKFYAPGSHYDCRETVDELVKDKERSNFCGSFSARTTFTAAGTADDRAAEARAAFDRLFGGE